MNSKLIFSFIGGLVAGGSIGFVAASKILDKKYFAKYDERVKELEEYYGRLEEYDRINLEDSKIEHGTIKAGKIERENGPLTKHQRDDIKNKLLRNEKQTTNYASMYKPKAGPMAEALEESLAEGESPEEDTNDVEDNDAQDPDDAYYERAFDEHQKNKNREPRIISAEAAEGLGPEWDHQTLLFYMYNDALTTEDDDLIEIPYDLVGDCLYKYGFTDNDEMVIYVQNFALTTVYEVQKVMAAFN